MILPLVKQVCSLELAKRLKELGAPQDSVFYWEAANFTGSEPRLRMANGARDVLWNRSVFDGLMTTSDYKQTYAAYTAAELWSFLPQFLQNRNELGEGFNEELMMYKNDPKNGEPDYSAVGYGFEASARHDNAVEAIAQLLIYLLEQKLITL